MNIDEINLIPRELKSETTLSSSERALLLLFLIELIFILLLGLGQYYKKTKLDTQIEKLKYELLSLESNFKNITQQQIIHENEVIKSNILNEVMAKKNRWSLYFKELSLLLPENTWLTYLMIEKKDDNLSIDVKGEANSPKEISDFYLRLSHSIYFENIIIKQSELMENYNPTLYKFFFSTATDKLEEIKKEDEDKDRDDSNNVKDKINKTLSEQIKDIQGENKNMLLNNNLLKSGID